ncbi:hypothetical protein BJF79_38735 [Actinomadura sp. CNU-125]|uniref:hypothetical protein n=1 Tax=Actinomadura sp. CNU-125 TaxID=1904961 RepID=UPI0009616D73|nr:hypothetical protein [Actinomadura sp. CNU-125]OLT30531.1 hypothetical protein BJF79_38735 [Actinomadura sp. CNU-125]
MDGTDVEPQKEPQDEPRDGTGRDAGVFAVRDRTGWRGVWRSLALLILLLASVGFVTGGAIRGLGVASAVFAVLGAGGIVLFGWGLLVAVGELTARRPVLEFDADGVRRPARWPLPKRAARTLAWDDVAAMARSGAASRARAAASATIWCSCRRPSWRSWRGRRSVRRSWR